MLNPALYLQRHKHLLPFIFCGAKTFSSKMPPVFETEKTSPKPPAQKAPRLELDSPVSQNSAQLTRPVLKFAKLTDNALTPTRGSKQAAGFDLYRYMQVARNWDIENTGHFH